MLTAVSRLHSPISGKHEEAPNTHQRLTSKEKSFLIISPLWLLILAVEVATGVIFVRFARSTSFDREKWSYALMCWNPELRKLKLKRYINDGILAFNLRSFQNNSCCEIPFTSDVHLFTPSIFHMATLTCNQLMVNYCLFFIRKDACNDD